MQLSLHNTCGPTHVDAGRRRFSHSGCRQAVDRHLAPSTASLPAASPLVTAHTTTADVTGLLRISHWGCVKGQPGGRQCLHYVLKGVVAKETGVCMVSVPLAAACHVGVVQQGLLLGWWGLMLGLGVLQTARACMPI
jgi:hypothetical protein